MLHARGLIALTLALSVSACAPQVPHQRTQEQCRRLYTNSQDLAAHIYRKVQAAAAAPDIMTQAQQLSEAELAESRWRSVMDIMIAGDCCRFSESCVALVGVPES